MLHNYDIVMLLIPKILEMKQENININFDLLIYLIFANLINFTIYFYEMQFNYNCINLKIF